MRKNRFEAIGQKPVKSSEPRVMGKEPGEPLNCPMERNFRSQDKKGNPREGSSLSIS